MIFLWTFWLFYLLHSCKSWDYDGTDFEIFDLFEEVNGTFYELLEITQEASVKEIKKAYRQKSIVLHPDRNSAEDAEQKFRQLVAVYEILKDKEKREKYDNVLKNGLPTWRQPAYYYRKYRKMGTLELSLIVSIIATIGHYLTWLVAYWEKKFEMDEVLNPLRKRQEKKKAKGKLLQEDLDTDAILQKELGYRKPTGWDLLPFVIYRFLVSQITRIPSLIKEISDNRKKEKERKLREEEEEREAQKAREAEKLRPKRIKEKPVLRDASEFESEEGAFVCSSQNNHEHRNSDVRTRKDEEWTEEDYASLAKAMCKYPAGTLGRWERIGHDLGRRGDEITKKVKEMKSTIASNLPSVTGTAALSTKKKTAINISDSIITKTIDLELKKTSIISDSDLYQSQYDIPDDYDEGKACEEEPVEVYTSLKKKVKTRPVEENLSETLDNSTVKTEIAVDSWTQVQQKCLEAAISQFPKSTTDRWSCIARAVPDKTKEQCIARYKALADHVKKRKSQQGS